MGYRHFLLVFVLISFSHWAVALSKWPRIALPATNYTAVNSTQATLTFSYAVEFVSEVKPDRDKALEVIESHCFTSMDRWAKPNIDRFLNWNTS